MQPSSDRVRRTEADLAARRVQALRVIRRGAEAAYFQGAAAVLVCAVLASDGDVAGGLQVLTVGGAVLALGAWLGRRKAATPAALLVALVLAAAIWLWALGVHLAIVLAVTSLAWRFGEAFGAARELAVLGLPSGEPLMEAT